MTLFVCVTCDPSIYTICHPKFFCIIWFKPKWKSPLGHKGLKSYSELKSQSSLFFVCNSHKGYGPYKVSSNVDPRLI